LRNLATPWYVLLVESRQEEFAIRETQDSLLLGVLLVAVVAMGLVLWQFHLDLVALQGRTAELEGWVESVSAPVLEVLKWLGLQ